MRAKLADLANRTAAFAAYVDRLQAATSHSERAAGNATGQPNGCRRADGVLLAPGRPSAVEQLGICKDMDAMDE